MDVSLIENWRGRRICVLGDVMLDRFVYGRVERVSPEGPIPVLHFESEALMLGGAANVARNIVALGGTAVLLGVLGQDEAGDQIAGPMMSGSGIDGRFVRTPAVPTTVKTRYVSGGQQIMRLDVERPLVPDESLIDALCRSFAEVAEAVDAVVLSDYAKGVLAPAVIRRVIELARQRALPVIVDPKSRDVSRYAGASLLAPNAAEAALITGLDSGTDEAAKAAVKAIRERAAVAAVVLTRGAQGMTIYDPASGGDEPLTIATVAAEVFDVSGAGDTVMAALSLALAAGLGVAAGAQIANVAAGISVGKRGTAVVQRHELAMALRRTTGGADPKIVSNEEAATIVAHWREQGLRIGFTNGCFDLLHPGHVALLKRAREACGRLVVALNSDVSVRRLKGETRPVQNEAARSVVMASLSSVDLVTLFEEDTPIRLIGSLKPDCLFKGADYTVETVVGADFVQSHGGKVILIPIEEGFSSSSIISRSQVRETT
ncbi:MAG: D-glycero-beta-D-manno-heptose 1-phosphate adenylyltransferase [Kiloniellales bacterium]